MRGLVLTLKVILFQLKFILGKDKIKTKQIRVSRNDISPSNKSGHLKNQILKTNDMKVLRNNSWETEINRIRTEIRESCGKQPNNE